MGEVPVGTAEDVVAAVARARRAQQAWAATPVRDRAAVLLRYHDLVLDRQDELLDLIQAENGKARVWAFEEIMDQAVTARYYARLAPRALKPQRRLSALPGLVSTREHYLPKGVVGVISPWNYPLVLAVSDALAALVAGNGIVIKPDSQTPVHRPAGVRAARGGRAARRPRAGRRPARAARWAPPSSRTPTT